MKRLTAASAQDTLERLVGAATVSGSVQRSDDTVALIRSFQSHFNRLNRTPEMIRVMLQCEFGFDGVVDAAGVEDARAQGRIESSRSAQRDAGGVEDQGHIDAKQGVLEADWFQSSFVVVNYSDVETWLKKVIQEAEKGRVVVALIPARTNTQWFHDLVLESADEVRFVKGRVTFPGRTAPSAYPDALAIYRARGAKAGAKAAGVAILKCETGLTTDTTRFHLSSK